MKIRTVLAVAAACLSISMFSPAIAGASSLVPVPVPASHAVHPDQGGVGPGTLQTQYILINVKTYNNWTDKTQIVAKCRSQTTCTLTYAQAYATTLNVALGFTKSGLSATLGFSETQTNTTSVLCPSPQLKPNQTWVAYRIGTGKTYQIQEWQWSLTQGPQNTHKLIGTSAPLGSFEPDPYASLDCQLL